MAVAKLGEDWWQPNLAVAKLTGCQGQAVWQNSRPIGRPLAKLARLVADNLVGSSEAKLAAG